MVNYKLKGCILETIDNQMRDNDPKCTNEVFEKLISVGYTENKAKEIIAAVLIEEMYDIMKNQQPFNEERYSNKLYKLLEYEDEEREEGLEENYEDEILQTTIRNENKIGRNSVCPCGSGKKYKRCCGKNI
ncbi:SEC-C domain-containing protein [Clostridium estertheticum]|uniref:SEC-C metal-binding domain-containing protein n=1 Tax=Clostridium estertheticum TaxID=238834 RepID=UPI001CCAF82B|nr:SEC-C metal-binding domain-containing protein [Clostridium estertheticum]MBZ9606310.1 SEC-C domain-containing protein [Clostridium estertheticum]